MSRNIKPEDRVASPKSDESDTESDSDMEEGTNPLRDTQQSNGGTSSVESDIDALIVGVRNETTYYVGNPESGTAYLVNMCDPEHEDEMTCTCPDYRYRASPDEDRACKHIMAVIDRMPANVGIETVAYQGLKAQYEILEGKVDSVVQDLSVAQSNAAPQTQTQNAPESPSNPSSESGGHSGGESGPTADEAAQELQSAFDGVVSGMNTLAAGNRVWVNKSPDAPDYTFDAFLSGPQLMKYDPDNAPQQYYKNYIEPGDVQAYISEVLG